MIANLVKDPSDFFQNVLTGLNNGALYALIALGYTLVYGIIELINFAHGDLFMLGTILAANVMVELARPRQAPDRSGLSRPGADHGHRA